MKKTRPYSFNSAYSKSCFLRYECTSGWDIVSYLIKRLAKKNKTQNVK